MGLSEEVKKRATALAQRALTQLFADERRANAIAGAIGKAQQGKEAFDRGQNAVLHQFQFATKADFKALSKKLSGLKRRVEALSKKAP
jgi:hypothetical protein